MKRARRFLAVLTAALVPSLLVAAGCEPQPGPPTGTQLQKASGRTPDPARLPKGGNINDQPRGGILSVPGKGGR